MRDRSAFGESEDELVNLDSDGALVQESENEAERKAKAKAAKKRKKLGVVEYGDEPEHELLLIERINAKLFQFKLKRMGIALSLWEVFTIFEFANMKFAKMTYEPQRCHFVLFEHFYKLMTSGDYKSEILYPGKTEEETVKSPEKKKKKDKPDEEALDLAD